MELLILRTGDDYLRIVDGAYRRCGLDRASVFPLSRLEEVRGHQRRLGELGFTAAEIRRLRIEELPFEADPGSPRG